MIADFGFDLAERSEPRLWRGLAFGVAAALVEALLYVELYRVLIVVFGGNADLWLALEAGLLLLIGNVVLVACKARANVESIAFEDVTFAYDPREGLALRNICGRIPEGRMVALVGPSGSGKSTLAHLVARLWDAESGSIRVGGVDLRALPAETLARSVAMVLQDVVLFEGTIADNIRLGRPGASDDAVERAARAARAHGFIARLRDGYATRLDAEGGPLSGGERQRIAIARALLNDAPILVLDEATANIDFENEAEIQAALGSLTQGRTLLVIAHRLWTVTGADEIWVIDRGRIVQRGPHDRLLAEEGGLYRRLWDAQSRSRSWRIAGAAAPPPGQDDR